MKALILTLRMPALLLAFLLSLSACDAQQKPGILLNGATMGTQWHIALLALPNDLQRSELQAHIDQRLKQINNQMSTWQIDSQLSQFNQTKALDWHSLDAAVIDVVKQAQQISILSQGAFDITVGPLVNLWGFGPRKPGLERVKPDAANIATTKARVGYQQLQYRSSPPALKKAHPELYVDLSAIAKGYAVDVIARYFDELGVQDYMVEVGGEVFARGNSPRGDQWRIAIEKPVLAGREVQQGLHLQNQGLATSGDYRNFFAENGQRYSHTIDTQTGYPVKHQLASVSVLASSTMLADGYATMLMAMGEVKGKQFADEQGLAAYFIWRTDDGFETYTTDAFRKALVEL